SERESRQLRSELDLPGAATADAPGLRREAIVVAHDEVRFNLLHGIHGDADDDQQRGSAEVEVEAEAVRNPGGHAIEEAAEQPEMIEVNARDEEHREDGDDDEVDGADERDAREDVVDEVRGALAGAD